MRGAHWPRRRACSRARAPPGAASRARPKGRPDDSRTSTALQGPLGGSLAGSSEGSRTAPHVATGTWTPPAVCSTRSAARSSPRARASSSRRTSGSVDSAPTGRARASPGRHVPVASFSTTPNSRHHPRCGGACPAHADLLACSRAPRGSQWKVPLDGAIRRARWRSWNAPIASSTTPPAASSCPTRNSSW